MANNTSWESFKAEGAKGFQRLKELIDQGNLRRVVVEHKGKTVAEFPLTVGVIGILAAPILAAVGSLIALLKECTIHVEVAQPGASSETAGQTDHAPTDPQC